MAPIGYGVREPPAYVGHPWVVRPTGEHERGDCDPAGLVDRDRTVPGDVTHDLRVVGECGCHRLQLRPSGGLAHPFDHLLWHTHVRHEQFDRIATAVLRQHSLEVLAVLPRALSLLLA